MSLGPFAVALVVPPLNLLPLGLAGIALAWGRQRRLGLTLASLSLVGLLVLALPFTGGMLIVSLERNLPLTPPPDDPPRAIVVLAAEVEHGSPGMVAGENIDLGPLTLLRVRAGAELADLVGVAETSLVTSGMPAYALAIEIIAELIESSETSQATPAHEAIGGMWDRRFSEKPWPSDPDALLVELAASLPPGRGIDLGSGPGRNSLWLAAKGWDMTLLDSSGVALAQAEERAKEAGVPIKTVHEDVLGWRPAGPIYDLVVVANLHPGVDALGKVLAAAADALVAGGHLFVVGHDITSLGHHGPPDPDRLLSVERLSRALPRSVSVETLGLRARGADHAPAPDLPAADANRPDVAVLAWATKRAA